VNDRLLPFRRFSQIRFKDMGDGTVAPVVVAATLDSLEATNGDIFPTDVPTVYEYDSSGENITRITKTTPQGVVYVQDWIWNGPALGSTSGWVRQP
jgi:hypothetical protein